MALTDLNFQAGEGQDFILELPDASYTGELNDILTQSNEGQYILSEIPEVVGGQGNNIFISVD